MLKKKIMVLLLVLCCASVLVVPAAAMESTETEPATSVIQLWDSSGNEVIKEYSGGFPLIVAVTDTGLSLSFDDVYFVYSFDGAGTFLGVDLRDGASAPQYRPGERFELAEPVNLYIYSDGAGTEPTDSPSDQEKDEANDQGNSSVGDLTDAIPDYSTEFIKSLQDLANACGYEGTSCVLPIPAIVFPKIPGLIPEFQLMPASSLDLEDYIQLMPASVLLLVQSLLTVALIIYCFKELYDLISYLLTLRGGN